MSLTIKDKWKLHIQRMSPTLATAFAFRYKDYFYQKKTENIPSEIITWSQTDVRYVIGLNSKIKVQLQVKDSWD